MGRAPKNSPRLLRAAEAARHVQHRAARGARCAQLGQGRGAPGDQQQARGA